MKTRVYLVVRTNYLFSNPQGIRFDIDEAKELAGSMLKKHGNSEWFPAIQVWDVDGLKCTYEFNKRTGLWDCEVEK